MKEMVRIVVLITAFISQLLGMAMMLEGGADQFEGVVTFFLVAILCLLWVQVCISDD